jgi:predicted nucleic acid-binding protein
LKVHFDTSVLIAACVAAHPDHPRSVPWLERAKNGQLDLFVAAHSLAEMYAVLSSLPLKPRISPATARRLVRENAERPATVIALSTRDYGLVLQRIADLGLAGGLVYDALIAYAAEKAGIDRLLTLNVDHFRRAWPEAGNRLEAP